MAIIDCKKCKRRDQCTESAAKHGLCDSCYKKQQTFNSGDLIASMMRGSAGA